MGGRDQGLCRDANLTVQTRATMSFGEEACDMDGSRHTGYLAMGQRNCLALEAACRLEKD